MNAQGIGYFEPGSETKDYAERVDDYIENLNHLIAAERSAGRLIQFPYPDWIDFKATWGIFRDEVFSSFITWGMYATVESYHRQYEAWKKLYNKMAIKKANVPTIETVEQEDTSSGFGFGSAVVLGGIALLGLAWMRQKKS